MEYEPIIFFKILAPSKVIYEVDPGGNIIWSTATMSKYLYNTTPASVHKINITVTSVNEMDGGIYKSFSSIGQNGSIDECCLLIVSRQPTKPVLLQENKYPFVGDDIGFTCTSEVQRWPVGMFSSLKYTFSSFGKGIQQENKLTIYNVSKSDKGSNISCHAVDDLGKVSERSNNITLDIFYGPEDVTFSPARESVTLTSGEKLGPIICSAKCNPECEKSWKKTTPHVINTNGILILNRVTKEDGGIYQCTATQPMNTSKSLSKNISVTVHYPPSISYGYVTVDDEPLLKDRTTYTFTEDSKVGVILTIDSNPPVNLSPYLPTFSGQSLNFIQRDLEYSLQLPPMQCEESGEISIIADNGIKNKTEWKTQFDIQCKPKDVQLYREKIGTQLGAEEIVCLYVVSNPQPTIQWTTKDSNLAKWNIQLDQGIHKYNATSTVKIEDVSDIRQYTIIIKNRQGWISQNVTFFQRGKPEQPSNVFFADVSFREATVSWTAGFDGGDRQNFTINYKRTIDDKWIFISVSSDKTLKGTKVYYTLRGLLPKTSYDVVLVAKNRHGSSNVSLHLTTENNDSSTTSWIIGCLTVVVVVVVIAVFSHLLRTYRQRPRDRNPVNKTHSQDNISDEVNNLYEEIDDTALNNVPMQVVIEDRNVMNDKASSDNDESVSVDSNRTGKKSLNAGQDRTSYEHPYHSLEENWRCNEHAYDVAMISQLKSYENIVDLGNTYESTEGNMTAHVQEFVNTADTTTRVLSPFVKAPCD